jgi:hypothetical protein
MTEPAIDIVRAAPAGLPPRPAWARAGLWSLWIGTTYAAVLALGRMLVVFRFGGQMITPYFLAILASAVATAAIIWPPLAHAARRPALAELIRAVLQWSAILGLGLCLLVGAGALTDDESLKLVKAYVARDLVAGR